MTARASIAFALAVALLASFGPAQGAQESAEYFASTDTYVLCDKEPLPGTDVALGVNLGAVCFEVTDKQKARVVSISDAVSPSVGFFWLYADENFNSTIGGTGLTEDPVEHLLESCTECGFECDSMAFIEAPKGAKYFYVFLDGPAFGALDCGPGEGFSTTGTVVVDIRNK